MFSTGGNFACPLVLGNAWAHFWLLWAIQGGGCAAGIWWVETRDAVHHPAVPRMVPTAESDPALQECQGGSRVTLPRESGLPFSWQGCRCPLSAGISSITGAVPGPPLTLPVLRGDRLTGCVRCGSSGVWPESRVHSVLALAAESLQNTRSRQLLKRPCF